MYLKHSHYRAGGAGCAICTNKLDSSVHPSSYASTCRPIKEIKKIVYKQKRGERTIDVKMPEKSLECIGSDCRIVAGKKPCDHEWIVHE